MSGICGLVRFDNSDFSPNDLARMQRSLSHLGEHDTSSWIGGRCALGALRTNVVLEDRLEVQPLCAGAISFVSDARIDNRDDLAAALGIAELDLAGMADSALIFAAWRAWGEAAPERLVGDFVFAVWDADARELTLCRDHMGQRRLVYHRGDGFFAFATEAKGLWALPDVPRVLTERTIELSLALVPEGARTGNDNPVVGLTASTILRLDAKGNLSTRRYWEPHAAPEHLGKDEAYYIAAYRSVLTEAVACRVRRNIDSVGVFMSGGFDSTAICALAAPIATAEGNRVIAASSVMPENKLGAPNDAFKRVEQCARHIPGLDVRYTTREGLDALQGLEQAMLAGEGFQGPNRYANDALFRIIREAGARVVMDGYGGDYTLNPRGQIYLLRSLSRGRLLRFVREWRARRRFLQTTHGLLLRQALLPFIFFDRWRQRTRRREGLPPTGPTMPLSPSLKERLIRDKVGYWGRPASSTRANQLRTLDRLQNSPRMGGAMAAAARGLTLTQPFHDKRVVEFALAVPEELDVKNGRERHLARTALADLYPPEFQNHSGVTEEVAPDFADMVRRIEPQLFAEIDRMERSGRLDCYFDFDRMRKMLRTDGPNGFARQQAMMAFLYARSIEWFRGYNR